MSWLHSERAVAWASGFTLDLRLGARMLRKYPGLTTVGVVGMGMAVAIASFMFTMVELAMDPVLPLPHGDRIVGIRAWDYAARAAAPSTARDYEGYRESLRSLEAIGAFRMAERNLILADSTGEEVFAAEMTASAFVAAGVKPLLGRTIDASDEVPGRPLVAMISHDLWRRRFGRDPAVLGTVVRLGLDQHTIVGIMPAGYAFPVAQEVWTPLRLPRATSDANPGPPISIFGRLAPGATRADVESHLAVIARRSSAGAIAERPRLEPHVTSFAALAGFGSWSSTEDLGLLPLFFPLLLILVCVNVATLIYARTASRQTEIAVRASLGASRARIIGQLFAEGLVLSAGATMVGLTVSRAAFGLILGRLAAAGAHAPFWIRPHVSFGLVLYALALTLLAAIIIGIVPARSLTREGLRATLSQLASGASMRLGRGWTSMVVAQVGVAVAVLPGIVTLCGVYGYYAFRAPGFAAERYLTATVEFDESADPATTLTRIQRLARLEERLEAEPGIAAVSFSTALPGQEPLERIELDSVDADAADRRYRHVRRSAVGEDFLAEFDIALRAGRAFSPGDFEAGARTVVVNEEFVRDVLAGRGAIGRRIRRAGEGNNRSVAGRLDAPGRAGAPDDADRSAWLEIVGVVADFPNRMNPEITESRIYEPVRAGDRPPLVMLSARTTGAPGESSARVQKLALTLDPGLRLGRVLPLDLVYREGARGLDRLASFMMALITLSVLALTSAGIYALMSFTVTRCRREIGIRAALGAEPWRLLAGVFARATLQLGAGCGVGLALAFSLDRWGSSGEMLAGHGAVVLPAVVALMLVTGLLAALGPARRGLRIDPAEALRSE